MSATLSLLPGALLWRFRMPLEAPPGALSHFLLAGCLWFSSSSLLLWFWLLLAFARPLLPLLPLISYTTFPLPLCVVIAPFYLAFISFFVYEVDGFEKKGDERRRVQ